MTTTMTTTTSNTKAELRRLRMTLVASGISWGVVKNWDLDEATAAAAAIKVSYVSNPVEAATKAVALIQAKKAHHKVVDINNALEFIKRFDVNSFDFDSCEEEEAEVLAEVLDKMVGKAKAKLVEKEGRVEMRTSNRGLYLPQVTLIHENAKNGKRRWRFETDLISTGLLPRMLESVGSKIEGEPLSLRLVNNLDAVQVKDTQQWVNPPIDPEEWEILRSNGWLPTQGNLAWNWRNEDLRVVLLNCFPKAIDFGAYNHRLNAPLIPGGYFEKVSVRFSNPMALDPEPRDVSESTLAALAEMSNEIAYFERDQECDGAGLYNPNHPMMQELVGRYGKVVFQITILRKDGLFGKGIIVPREGLECAEAFVLDMAQVKGAFKSKVVEGQVESDCYVGLMKAWDRQSYFPGCFELLEFVRLQPGKTASLEAAIKSLVNESFEEITKNGLDGLLAEAARDDEHLKLIVKVVAQIRAHGVNLNPLSIPMLEAALEDKLRSKLWIIAQGAGIRGKQYVTVLDATVPEGKCVLSGFKPGKSVAIWRFPCVLPQGLVTAEVIHARPHHKVDGHIIPNTIFLNPRDLTARMQGDDDGDIVGVSDDERVLEIFKYRASERVYLIEPKGDKSEVLSESPEGYKYLETDPRGPVGRTTIWQAQLLAVGDWWGAISMAVLNQEAIDAAKRKVRWTDISKACLPTSWKVNAEGNYELDESAKLSTDQYESEPGFPDGWPGEMLSKWVEQRLNKFGCIRNRKIKQNPLAWRAQTVTKDGQEIKLRKRVSRLNFVPCAHKSRGYLGGNLVHFTHDYAQYVNKTMTQEWEAMFGETGGVAIETRELLFSLMEKKGIKPQLTHKTWESYTELREKSGITAFGKGFKSIFQKRNMEEGERFSAIETLNHEFHASLSKLSPAELATVWYWELTPTWSVAQFKAAPVFTHDEPVEGGLRVNKENYAFRAISFPGSPILEALGIDDVKGCDFLLDGLAEKVSNWCMSQPQPFAAMAERMYKNTSHGDKVVGENGKRVEFHQCKHCMETLATHVVKAWRASKTTGEREFMRQLVRELNQAERVGIFFYDDSIANAVEAFEDYNDEMGW